LPICEELGVAVPEQKESIKALTDALNHHLLGAHAKGRRTILVVDEAQNLAPAVLEQVRLLTNLETAKQKLLQIILIGQPELRDLLGRNDLRQLAQRITGRYHLEPLTREETSQYIEHRLRVAGALGEVIDNAAKKQVFQVTDGVPRLINVICDRALLGAYSQESRVVTKRLIKRAAAEVSGELGGMPLSRRLTLVVTFVALVAVAGFWATTRDRESALVTPNPAEVAQAESGVPEIEAAPPPLSSPDTPTLAEALALAGELTTPDFAMASLFELWGIEYTRGSMDACAQAAAAGLACLSQRGSWNGLRQLNRPAILTLVDDSGDSHEIVLTGLHGDKADLSIGGVGVTHSVTEITDLWFGQFLLLWRPPGGVPLALVPGSRGAEVVRLRNNLAAIDARYRTNDIDSDQYDANLQSTVRQFQKDYRLDVDGLAGQQTLIVMGSLLAADDSPRLIKPEDT
jgi:general secretion pathway protein A